MLEERADERLGGGQLRRPFVDPPLQPLVELRQLLLSLFRLGDIVRHADKPDMFACRAPSWLRLRPEPPPLAVAATVASLDRDNPHGGFDGGLFRQDSRKIVGVKRSTPIEIERLRVGEAEKVEIGLIDEFPFRFGSGHPDQHRSAVCYGAEPRLAFGDLLLGDLSLRDVADHDVHAEGAARSVAMRDVNDLCRQRAGRTDKIDFVGHALAGQRALQVHRVDAVRRAHMQGRDQRCEFFR